MMQRMTIRARLAEGAVILGSILIAFWIDAAWDNRTAARLEAAMAAAVAAEIAANRVGLQTALEETEAQISFFERFVRISPAEADAMPPDTVDAMITALGRSPEHEPLLVAANSLLQTPAPSLAGLEAQSIVGEWVQAVADYEVEREVLQARQQALQHEFSRLAVPYAVGGLLQPGTMIARSRKPGVVAEVRGDDAMMTAVIEMGISQRAYRNRIRRLLTVSDSMASDLEALVGRRR